MSILSKVFGDANEKYLQKIQLIIEKANSLEIEFKGFSDEKIKEKTQELKQRVKTEFFSEDIVAQACALVREAGRRTLNQRHFDVQLIGGIVLHEGKVSEMKTGEGKTLTATLPLYLNALEEKGCHLITVNDYLARRDTVWMGQIYNFLGISVACINHEQSFIYDPSFKTQVGDKARDNLGSFHIVEDFLKPCTRKEAYAADITYGTNNEFGFDYLRDNMVYDLNQKSQRGHNFAIVDEVDSILIDEARTPLIISQPDAESSKMYEEFSRITPQLKENEDFNIDEKMRAITLTEAGINRVEQILNLSNIYEEKGIRYVHHLEEALKAEFLFKKDKDYVVKDGEIIIVDDFTGRLLPGRRYSGGLHQAIEAKEKVMVQPESLTLASITFQNYFRMYKKISGMTGTAITSAEEFHKVYNLDVIKIPTNKPMVRNDLADKVYKTEKGKFKAVVGEIKKRHEQGQPVLIGTTSIEKNEYLGKLLDIEGVPHQILNAKNHEKEGEIIAQAGKLGQVTVATNMAGRGVDIILGGNPQNDPEQSRRVKDLGGLCVIGTERHEARRIDNQLRGRAGRQGDPGVSQFFVSLEDDLMRIFGGDRIKQMMERMGVAEDQPIENGLISRAIESAQSKIEGFNFDLRKHILDYDDVMNKHRETIYKKRKEILESQNYKEEVLKLIEKEIKNIVFFHTAGEWNLEEIFEQIQTIFPASSEVHAKIKEANNPEEIIDYLVGLAKTNYENKEKEVGETNMRQIEKIIPVRTLDSLWIEHLENMDYLKDSVRIRAYGNQDPLIEYKNEGHKMFKDLLEKIDSTVVRTIFKVTIKQQTEQQYQQKEQNPQFKDVGRNDLCPCGSGKKFKKCHGK